MKIAIATVQVPFITGGAEILTANLKSELIKRGYDAEIVSIPFKWYPSETLINSMIMGRMMDLTEVNGEKIDLVISMKFPAYYVKHENKVVWLMHQHRQAYELWGTKYGDIQSFEDGNFIKDLIIKSDNEYIKEAKKIFTIANNVTNRLEKFNNIHATTLYPPPQDYEKFHCKNYGDYIFYPSRIDEMKRQRVLVEAAKYLKSDTKIYIAGGGSEKEINYIKEIIAKNKLEKKVKLLGYISADQKIEYYANCLGVYFGAIDEDYGYITLESFFSKKPIIVHTDAGGPLEFVIDGYNGFVIEEDAKLVAQKIDKLAEDKLVAQSMGENGYKTIMEKNISWDYVIDNLLSK
ncbi:MAG: glycosyltransferase family 4 protein [Ignavibacteriales bacterium]